MYGSMILCPCTVFVSGSRVNQQKRKREREGGGNYTHSPLICVRQHHTSLLSVAVRIVSVGQMAGCELVAVNDSASIDIQRSIASWTCTSGRSDCLSVCPEPRPLSDWTGCVARETIDLHYWVNLHLATPCAIMLSLAILSSHHVGLVKTLELY